MDIHEGTDHIVRLAVPRRMIRRNQASAPRGISVRVTYRKRQKVIGEEGSGAKWHRYRGFNLRTRP